MKIDFRKHIEKSDESKLTKRTRLFTGYNCNIKCKFCFYAGLKDKDKQKIKRNTIRQISLSLKYGIKDLDISGGEPTILPHWFDLLSYLRKCGFRKIAVITNGYKLADRDFFRRSADEGLNEVLFSLHGSNTMVHDGLTGVKGSLDRIIEAIVNANLEKIPIRINTVVAKENYKNLPDIAKMANAVKPIAFNFLPFRIENNAPKENTLRYTDAMPYIRDAIQILDKDIKIAIRYVPFCIVNGLEKYNINYIQRMFDPDEWSEYLIRKFEKGRNGDYIPDLDLDLIAKEGKWSVESDAIFKSIFHVAYNNIECLKCKYLYVCDGIWRSYSDIHGESEFKAVPGEKIKCIL